MYNGPRTSTLAINRISSPKSKRKWNENDKKIFQLNVKAMNVLYQSIDVNEFNRIPTYISIKEIWDRLQVTYEETNRVKESKINVLIYKYELFKIEPNESITKIYTRFTNIINVFKNLGKSYINSELVQKIIICLSRI